MLAEVFELSCLTVPTSDRSSFMDLVELVRAELRVRALAWPYASEWRRDDALLISWH